MLQFNVVTSVSATADSTDTLPDIQFWVPQDTISLRDLIARTVEQQIADLLDNHDRSVRDSQRLLDRHYLDEHEVREQAETGKIALTKPTPNERLSINTAEEIKRAQRGFVQQRYMIFINGRQLLDLDEFISYPEAINVKFIRLMPLAGG